MIDATAIFQALESHALSLGIFGAVNRHEPASPAALGDAMTLILECGTPEPCASASGLNSISYRWQIDGTIYRNVKTPDDFVEPELVTATLALFTSFAGGFTLGGLIRNVDFYGADGEQLTAVPGWLPVDDDNAYRCMQLSIPLIINDVMDLVP